MCGVSRVLLLSLSCTPLLTLLFCIKCFGLPLGVGALVILTYITFLCRLFHASSVSLCCGNRSGLCRCWLSCNTFLCGLFQASSVSSCCGNKSGLCRRCQLWGTGSASRWSSSSQGQWLGSFLLLLRTVSSLNAVMTDTWSACWVILGVSMIHNAWQWHRLQDPYCAYIYISFYSGIGRFSEAGLHKLMPFVIFHARSRERSLCHSWADFWVGIASCCV